MANLLPSSWSDVDPGELRFILLEIIGGPGQYDKRGANSDKFYLPMARDDCRVSLAFADKRLLSIEPGPAFDPAQWDEVVSEVERRASRRCVGRDLSFSGYRVDGSWRGARSGVQILPPPADAPVAPVSMAEHPFVLEFPLEASDRWPITNFRRMRGHRQLSRVLNVLLRGGITTQPRRQRHFWAVPSTGQLNEPVVWVQEFYYANFGNAVQDELTPATGAQIEEIRADDYYAAIGNDGGPLRVPADLDESLSAFFQLGSDNHMKFAIAGFWLEAASRQWTISTSATFASLAIAIEALGDRSKKPTARFRDFIDRYAPGASLEERRLTMYALRSDILHGSGLMEMDRDAHFTWAPPEQNERDLSDELWGLTRVAVRNWLRDPTR